MKKTLILSSLTALAFGLTACGGATSSTTAQTNNKPANSATNSAPNSANKPASNSASKPALKNEKKPEGTSKTAKKVSVPENWIYTYDENKGYGFYLPEGSTGDYQKSNGVDVFIAQTPSPTDVQVMVLAYKDSKKTKEDLLNDAEAALKALGETVQAGQLSGESEDYYVADATSTDAAGKKSKMKIVVGTDVTDNYVMIVGTDEAKFDANKDVIDKIWGSFEMWSGGSSGNN